MPYLEMADVVFVHFNIVNNDYQQDSRVLYTFVPNESIGHFLDFLPKIFKFLKRFDSEFLCIDSKPLEIEDKVNINLVIN